jgi:hypothetical protein
MLDQLASLLSLRLVAAIVDLDVNDALEVELSSSYRQGNAMRHAL